MHLRPTWLALALTALLAVWAFEARAQNTETNPAPGVRHLHRRTVDQSIHVLFVDLCAAGVSVRTTAHSERGRKTSSFGNLVGAAAAINGDFFGSGFSTDGIAMHAGAAWPTGSDHTYVAPVMFGTARASIPPHEDTSGATSWAREIVSGHPSLVVAGQLRDNNGDTGLCRQRHPRTAVGLTQDRRTLILAVVDGRRSTRLGFTCDELAALMAFVGAHDAVNMDGGGSSTMWIRTEGGVVNSPSDSTGERTVGNHLAVLASGQGQPAHCPTPRFDAVYVGHEGWPSTFFSLTAGDALHGCLRFRNTGREGWSPGVTNLGTTRPRDRASPLYASDWLGPNRFATVDHVTPPGDVGRFCFTLRAPMTPGVYREPLNLVQEAVTWFSDVGGPADDVFFVEVTSVARPPDAGVVMRDAGVVVNDAGVVVSDAGLIARDAGVVVNDAGVAMRDAGLGSDAGAANMDAGPELSREGPTSCGACASMDQAGSGWLSATWLLCALACLVRRRVWCRTGSRGTRTS